MRNGQPSDVSVSFAVEADPPLSSLHWTFTPVGMSAQNITKSHIFEKLTFSMDNTTVTVTNVSLSDEGTFTLTVSNQIGTSNASTILFVYGKLLHCI